MVVPRRLLLISEALKQDGVIAVQAAHELGFTKNQVTRLVREGVFDRPERGVLRLVGSENSFAQSLRITVLRIGHPVMISHKSAGTLWQLEGVKPSRVEVTVPRHRRMQLETAQIHRTTKWRTHDIRWLGGLPVTTPEKTLVDLAIQLSQEQLEIALDDAIRRRLTTEERVKRVCDALAGRGSPGVGSLGSLLRDRGQVDALTESGFETHLLRVIRKAKLPLPETQHQICAPNGAFIMRADFAYPDRMIALEADSERWHMSRARFDADRRKRAQAEAIGWRILAFTYRQVHREPAYVKQILTQALVSES